MYTPSNKKKNQSIKKSVTQKRNAGNSLFRFKDNRPGVLAQRKLQETVNSSPKAMPLKTYQDMANNSLQAKRIAQLQVLANNHSAQNHQPILKKEKKNINDDAGLEKEVSLPPSKKADKSSGVVQRVVTLMNNPNPATKATQPFVFVTDLDPRVYFMTEKEAVDHERNIIEGQQALKIKSGRVPTVFTYFQTPMSQALGSNLQGPHTVADAPMEQAIKDVDSSQLNTVFGEQVPPFSQIEPILNEELKAGNPAILEADKKKDRYKKEYGQVHTTYNRLKTLKRSEKRDKVKRHLLRRGVNMHPYAAYLWNIKDPKTNVANFQKYMDGKGERKNMPAKGAIDKGFESFFLNGTAAQKKQLADFFKMRMKLLGLRKKITKKKIAKKKK